MIIGSIGLGLFILIIVWIIALIIFVVGVKFQSNIAWIALGLASTLTAIFFLIPVRDQKSTPTEEELEKDYKFIYRSIFLLVINLSAVIAFVLFFVLHCIEPIRAKSVKNFYTRTK